MTLNENITPELLALATIVWRFSDAPKELQALLEEPDHDEDHWIAFTPQGGVVPLWGDFKNGRHSNYVEAQLSDGYVTIGGAPTYNSDLCDIVVSPDRIAAAAGIADRLPELIANAFIAWDFRAAPVAFAAQSTCGGDEDWVGYIPPHLVQIEPEWMFCTGGTFGCSGVDSHPQPDGSVVTIGAHA